MGARTDDGKAAIDRAAVFPEPELPCSRALIGEGRERAGTVSVGDCAFLSHYGVASEAEYKRRRMAEGALTLHAQIGFRDPEKTIRAYAEIYESAAAHGYRVDRYGICFDWIMGYPADKRRGTPPGTGLILENPEDFARLTAAAPGAPHFGDFVIGTPAAFENTAAAIAAGSTSIGNLGQYFTYRMPHWDDDVATTAETLKAIALTAAQPVEVIVHSNLDDGFAALFCDLCCTFGAVLIERYIVEELVGGIMGHCYGHTFSNPLTRFAFQRALAREDGVPGTMVYGNTTSYGADQGANYASLAAYFAVDVAAQRSLPTGHAVNAVPVSEAFRIPDIDEIIDAQLFAGRFIERSEGFTPLIDPAAAEPVTGRIVEGGRAFRDRVLAGLAEAGIDTRDPFEMLLALRRIGGKRLEELFGPGAPADDLPRGREPLVRSGAMDEIEAGGEAQLAGLGAGEREAIARAGLIGCIATTDVHEYGKMMIENVMGRLGVSLVDGGVSSDPDDLVHTAKASDVDFLAISTYNGVALDYLRALMVEMDRQDFDVPVFIGGRLNQVPAGSNASLPVDVSADLAEAGAVVCSKVEDMLARLAKMAGDQPILKD